MMTVNATLDRTSLTQTVNGLAAMGKAEGLTVQFICWDAMRSWIINCLKFTAPWSKDGRPGNTASQRKTGEGAVEHDLDRAFARLDDRVTPFEKGGTKFLRIKESGAVFPVDAALWRPELEKHHLSVRNAKGRVPRQHRQAWVTPTALKAYTQSVQRRVGSLKSGWLPSLYHYAALSRGSTSKPTQWITRHGSVFGGYSGNMDAKGNGDISSFNTAPHSSAIRSSEISKAKAITEKGLRFGKNGVNYRLQRLIDQFNAGKTPKAELRAA